MALTLRFLARGLVATIIAAIALASPAAANPAVSPILECVAVNGDGTYTALFGYQNTSDRTITIGVGSANKFTPGQQDRGQITEFEPGRVAGAITATQPVGSPLNFKLGDTTVQATSESTPCSTAPQVAEAPIVAGLMLVAGMIAIVGYRRLSPAAL